MVRDFQIQFICLLGISIEAIEMKEVVRCLVVESKAQTHCLIFWSLIFHAKWVKNVVKS